MNRNWTSGFPAWTLMLLLVAGLSGGCALKRYRDADPPQVSVANIALAGMSIFEQKFTVDLRMRNPNDFDLPITGMEYKLRLDGVDFATGVSPRELTLPSYGEQVVSLDVYTNVINSIAKLQQWNTRAGGDSQIPYEVLGHLKLRNMPVRIPFRYAGKFDMKQFSPARLQPAELLLNER